MAHAAALADRVEAALGTRPRGLTPLAGGSLGVVARIDLAGGDPLVVKGPKPGDPDNSLVEARMLRHLADVSDLPVPAVVHAEPRLLILTYLEHDGGLSAAAEEDAGRLIAALHDVSAPRFGLDFDCRLGPLPQANGWLDDWIDFFRDRRLLPMARLAARAGFDAVLPRIERLADRLDRLIERPAAPALLHGDLWGGNILARGDRIAGFVDPAIYYGHREMDLAFATLFSSVGDRFMAAYAERRAIAPGFFELRRDLCNLWPLLVHLRLFGAGYFGRIDAILARHGL